MQMRATNLALLVVIKYEDRAWLTPLMMTVSSLSCYTCPSCEIEGRRERKKC